MIRRLEQAQDKRDGRAAHAAALPTASVASRE